MTFNNNQDSQAIMQRLQAPFPISDIEFRVGSTNADKTRGMALAYLTSRAVQARLDEVFGIGGWKTEFREWRAKGVICTISVKIDGEWISKEDGAEETDIEAIKGSLSDSFKRSAVHLGIGRYLYTLPTQWVAIKKAGSSYVLAEKPTLPAWALPSNEQQSVLAPDKQHSNQPVHQNIKDNVVRMEDKKPSSQQHVDLCECSICHKINVPEKVKIFSEKRWGKPVCFNCQQENQAQQKVSGNPAPAPQHYEEQNHDQPFDDNDEIPF